jgi:hypothetical protein
MVCDGCGAPGPVVGKFCVHCDHRARAGSFERRRPLGGSQWQALWGIDYSARPKPGQRLHVMAAVAAIAIAVFAVL